MLIIWSCLNTVLADTDLPCIGGGGGVYIYIRHGDKHLFDVHVILQDTPGFIVNRLLVPYMAEAVRMAERGECVYVYS